MAVTQLQLTETNTRPEGSIVYLYWVYCESIGSLLLQRFSVSSGSVRM